MSVKIIDSVGGVNEVAVDGNKNLMVSEGLPNIPATGGFYSVAGGPAGIVAAALASDTSLVAIRFDPAAGAVKAYITKFRLCISGATVGASAGVSGVLGLQRFDTATPSAGTARQTTINKQAPASSSSLMTSVQDLASALTVTNVVFRAEVAWNRLPLFVVNGSLWYEWIYEPSYPTVLAAGDGIVLRTRVALAATQTWVFSYTFHWFEE